MWAAHYAEFLLLNYDVKKKNNDKTPSYLPIITPNNFYQNNFIKMKSTFIIHLLD